MVWVGFVLRLLYLTLAHQYRIRAGEDHFGFGWEMGRIARALATGYGFADPFAGHTGPTAWNPPLYPLLLAAVFKLFGVYTQTSAWAILAINCVFSALTAQPVYELARRAFRAGTGTRANGRSIALWSGWLWALYPAAMQYAVHWVWDMSITAFLFTWVLVLALRVRGVGEPQPDTPEDQTTRRWLVFGMLWGLIALSNSSLLITLPVCGVWMIWRQFARQPAQAVAHAALAATCCFALLAPWVVRNERVFHKFIPMRGNLGPELYQCVLPTNHGFPWAGTVPHVPGTPELERYRQLGEVEYARQQSVAANAIIRSHPGRTAGFVLKRVYMYWFGVPHVDDLGWTGRLDEGVRDLNFSLLTVAAFLGVWLAWRKVIPGSRLFAWTLVLAPAIYYAIIAHARFRHPLEPLMTVLAVYLFQSAERGRRFSSRPVPS